jgi:hypothetical protein
MADPLLDNKTDKPKLLTDARLFELHEQAKDARVNSGKVSLTVDELLEILPPKPVPIPFNPTQPAAGDAQRPTEFKTADAPKP